MQNSFADTMLICSLLKSHKYHEISSMPGVNNPWAFTLEPLNLFHYFLNKKHMLFHPTAIPWFYNLFLRFRDRSLRDLYTIFFRNYSVSDKILTKYVTAETLAHFKRRGLLSDDNRFVFRFVPYKKLLVVTDRYERDRTDLAYIGRDSIILADLIIKYLAGKRFKKGLDLCTGIGILAMVISQFCEEVTGTDINSHALKLADLNLKLNNIKNVEFKESDLFQTLNDKFDLIVANPPYRFLPESVRNFNLDGFGGSYGIEKVCKILRDLDSFLKPGGTAIFISLSPIQQEKDLLLDYIRNSKCCVNCNIEISPLSLHIDREHHLFHKKHKISYFSYNLYFLKKEKTKTIKLFPLPFYKSVSYFIYIFAVNLFSVLSKRKWVLEEGK